MILNTGVWWTSTGNPTTSHKGNLIRLGFRTLITILTLERAILEVVSKVKIVAVKPREFTPLITATFRSSGP